VEQPIQTQIALEALENFQYDWAKLTINSEKENLKILMQMNGKPARSLSFGFNKNKGIYKSKDSSKEKANFQGIQFDINFNIPLNKILSYELLYQEKKYAE
jgi:hypothetical protein